MHHIKNGYLPGSLKPYSEIWERFHGLIMFWQLLGLAFLFSNTREHQLPVMAQRPPASSHYRCSLVLFPLITRIFHFVMEWKIELFASEAPFVYDGIAVCRPDARLATMPAGI